MPTRISPFFRRGHCKAPEQEAVGLITQVCQKTAPFEVTLGEVESFIPLTPTVFIRVAGGAYRMRELHEEMNHGALAYREPWPYMPHLTIVKADELEEARKALEIARRRWAAYTDTRKTRLKSLSFVKGNGDRWVNLVSIPFGGPTAG